MGGGGRGREEMGGVEDRSYVVRGARRDREGRSDRRLRQQYDPAADLVLLGEVRPVMIEDPPLLTIRRRIERPDAARLAKLAGVQTGNLVDAMDGRGALDFAIKPGDPKRASFVGPALTCEPGPSDNLAILAAIALAEPGGVIVAAGDGFTGTAIVGDNMAAMARNRTVAAIVADGLVRGSAGGGGGGRPVVARGITPNSRVRSGPGR